MDRDCEHVESNLCTIEVNENVLDILSSDLARSRTCM